MGFGGCSFLSSLVETKKIIRDQFQPPVSGSISVLRTLISDLTRNFERVQNNYAERENAGR